MDSQKHSKIRQTKIVVTRNVTVSLYDVHTYYFYFFVTAKKKNWRPMPEVLVQSKKDMRDFFFFFRILDFLVGALRRSFFYFPRYSWPKNVLAFFFFFLLVIRTFWNVCGFLVFFLVLWGIRKKRSKFRPNVVRTTDVEQNIDDILVSIDI